MEWDISPAPSQADPDRQLFGASRIGEPGKEQHRRGLEGNVVVAAICVEILQRLFHIALFKAVAKARNDFVRVHRYPPGLVAWVGFAMVRLRAGKAKQKRTRGAQGFRRTIN